MCRHPIRILPEPERHPLRLGPLIPVIVGSWLVIFAAIAAIQWGVSRLAPAPLAVAEGSAP